MANSYCRQLFCLPKIGILMAKPLTIPQVWKLIRAGEVKSKPMMVVKRRAMFVSTVPVSSPSALAQPTLSASATSREEAIDC